MIALTEKAMEESKMDLEEAANNLFDEEGRFLADTPTPKPYKNVYTPAPTPVDHGVSTLPPHVVPDYANMPLGLGNLGPAGAAGALKRLQTSQENLLSNLTCRGTTRGVLWSS